MLAEEGELRGLVGPRELPRLWSRHIVNSAAVVPFLPARGSVADVGSGAGFPGVVVALLRPDLDVTLIETMERRTQWLSDVVEELDLDGFEGERADLERLLTIDVERWRREMALREEHLARFDGLPEEIWEAHRRVRTALEEARDPARQP